MKNTYILFLVFGILFGFKNSEVKAETLTETPSTSQISSSTNLTINSLVDQIKQAKSLLNTKTLEIDYIAKYTKSKKTKKSVISGYTIKNKDIALAIFNPATNEISLVTGKQDGKKMVFSDPNFDIKLKTFNGVNSRFEIKKPSNGIVLALKYLITPTETGSKEKIKTTSYELVYVPYSENLNTPEVIAYGEKYITSIFKSVQEEIGNIPSTALPEKTVIQAIPASLVKAIIYSEHSSGGDYNAQSNAVKKVNVLFAGNEENTFNASVSSASARGMAQFIESTYYSLVKRHPEANLNPNFVGGMNDHKNAVKSIYLLLDDHVGTIRNLAGVNFNPAYVWEYAAASYNGGTTRIIRAAKNFGSKWDQDNTNQISEVQTQINVYVSEIKKLKKELSTLSKKKAINKEKISVTTSQISELENKLQETKTQLENIKTSALRNETVSYLNKIRNFMQQFNE